MGAGQSRNRNSQYPYGAPLYPPPYPPPQPPHPHFVPPYGYGQPVYPAGVVPPAAQFGQGQYLPPPLLNFLPQDKYFKKSSRANKPRRTQRDRFVGGFSSGAGMPHPEVSSRRTSESYARAREAPTQYGSARRASQSAPRRTATPFIPQEELDPEDYGGGHPPADDGAPNRSASRRSPTRYPTPPPIIADLAHVIDPLEPASGAAFGPPDYRPHAPLRNPLPPPPRDLYEMTPYKSLLSLPQTTALLTATYAPQHATLTAGGLTTDPSIKRNKSLKAGLLRAFSRKSKQKEPDHPQVRFIPVFTNENSTQHPPASASTIGPLPTSAATFDSAHATTSAVTPLGSEHPQPVPPVPTSPPAIRFDQTGRYSAFMNHSPHRVIWRGLPYPTALHLHEALKFMDHRPDLAEKIRTCERPEDVYPLSATFHQFQRPDWGMVFLELMKHVLYEKFRQHPDLRALLHQTGAARLIYVDADDIYWGSGAVGNGQNELGKALVEIRDRLFLEMNPTSHQ